MSVQKSGDREYNVTVTVTNTSETYSGKCSVPVYISKPYGEYAKTNGIQVPSVELVDFGKTQILAPGQSETLTIPVDEKFFASYDAYNAEGYVLMDGNVTEGADPEGFNRMTGFPANFGIRRRLVSAPEFVLP